MESLSKNNYAGYKYLEKRLFEYVCLIVFILAAYLAIQASLNTGGKVQITIAELIFSFLGLSFFILSKKGFFNYVRLPLIFLLITAFIYFWFSIGGYKSNMSVASTMIGIMVIVIGPKKYKFHLLILFLSLLALLTYIQSTHPELIDLSFADKDFRPLNFTILTFLTLFISYYVKAQYDNDRTLLFEQNNDLESLNDKLNDTNEELQRVIENLNTTKDQLIQSEKMASVGRITAGLAHELNNPLNYVSGGIMPITNNLKEIKKTIDKDTPKEILDSFEETELLLKNMSEGSSKISNVIANLVKISPQRDFSDYKKFNLSISVIEDIKQFKKLFPKIEVKNNINQNIFIIGRILEVRQAFNYLLENATDATSELSDPKVEINLSNENEYIALEISNNGSPVEEHIATKMYEPFFTTKDSSKHLGLGLYFVYSIIVKHSGSITYSRQNNLSSFKLVFPKG